MGTETSPPSSVSTDAMDDHPHSPRLGLPERMLQKMGFYHNPVLYVSISSSDPVLYRTMICLIASPYVVVYPICRHYCDAASCRYYRFNLFSALLLFFLFINYRASTRKDNTPTILRTKTPQQDKQAEKVSIYHQNKIMLGISYIYSRNFSLLCCFIWCMLGCSETNSRLNAGNVEFHVPAVHSCPTLRARLLLF